MESATRKESTAQCVNCAFGSNNATTGDGNTVEVIRELRCDDLA